MFLCKTGGQSMKVKLWLNDIKAFWAEWTLNLSIE